MLFLLLMKRIILFLVFLTSAFQVSAKHIIGGEMFYTYLGPGSKPNTLKYRITLRLFRDNYAPPDAAEMPQSVWITVFDNDTKGYFQQDHFEIWRATSNNVQINPFPECMVNAPRLGYQAAEFSFELDLPKNTNGYTASYQTCCRIRPIDNIFSQGSGEGSTFSCDIPPEPDNSPEFVASIDAVCGGKKFTLRFDAVDSDGDSLSYAFENAYDGGFTRNASNVVSSPPPYSSVNYVPPFRSVKPLGPEASIDPKTGIISGIAPRSGRYVITVAVTSFRNGKMLGVHRKDFIINVSDCDFATAKLDSLGVLCDSSVVTFHNDDFSPLNKTFYWEFYDASDNIITTSTDRDPQISFPDTGYYSYKLIINKDEQCSDSARNSIHLYPGFYPEFNHDGQCINADVFFKDQSTAKYGIVNFWKWDFGISEITSDTSRIKNPAFTYGETGDYRVVLTVGSDLGCRGSIEKILKMVEKPEFSVSNDTLICSVDQLTLHASGSGTIEWTPNYNIDNTSSFNPTVTPKHTTTYYANYEERRGCTNIDSVVVNVVDFVSLKMPADTTICLTDDALLSPLSNGLKYEWSSGGVIFPDKTKDLTVRPQDQMTTYRVVATIGGCSSDGIVRVKTVPYPDASAGMDTTICQGRSIQLLAAGGAFYEWQPAVFLNDTKIPDPISSPVRTISYIVKVTDILGCPKPDFDTVTVAVTVPHVDAGPRDTAIVIDEPLQLNAKGNGENFLWTPSTGLNNVNISNPIALLTSDQEFVVRILTEGNCLARDTIMVKVYDLKPGFYVPNAFSPNSDGLNDVIRPIAFGLRSLKYFRIYNRLGEMVFSTTSFEKGWDGTYKGSPQGSAVFVWIGEAEDYLGNPVQAKGNITLIR